MATETYLRLSLVGNGASTSAIDDNGKIWGTGGSATLLREVIFAAHAAGVETIAIGVQMWDVATTHAAYLAE